MSTLTGSRISDLSSLRLQVTEIYLSVQGESTWSGLPCTFIRLTGCPLRCSYCDTEYAFYGGSKMEISQVLDRVEEIGCNVVEVTGGEPLAQPNCIPLIQALLDSGYIVLLETSGAFPIAGVPDAVRKIMDLKTPSSGEMHRNVYENMNHLTKNDEVKFVLGSREDYEWACEMSAKYKLPEICNAVLFSCVFGRLEPARVVEWMTTDKLFGVRLQLQAHKYIWEPEKKGV